MIQILVSKSDLSSIARSHKVKGEKELNPESCPLTSAPVTHTCLQKDPHATG